jgi:hypothetical protein
VSQSRRGSAIEAVANVLIGYVVAVAAQIVIFPLFGVRLAVTDNMLIGVLFTSVSVIRSYALRRLFNRLRKL